MAKLKIGDIIEIPTSKGCHYAQYTHYHPDYGELIHVAKPRYDARPKRVAEIVECEVGIITFLFLKSAIREKALTVIGNHPVPESRRPFPVFRTRGGVTRDGVVTQWKFWDGEKVWPDYWIRKLTEEQKSLPIAGVWDDYMLIQSLEADWTPDLVKTI